MYAYLAKGHSHLMYNVGTPYIANLSKSVHSVCNNFNVYAHANLWLNSIFSYVDFMEL